MNNRPAVYAVSAAQGHLRIIEETLIDVAMRGVRAKPTVKELNLMMDAAGKARERLAWARTYLAPEQKD